MSSITTSDAAKLRRDLLVAGASETIYTMDQFTQVLPVTVIGDNAISYNQEAVAGDVGRYAVGDTITAKAPATTTKYTSTLVKIIGDAEVDDYVEEGFSSEISQTDYQILSKAKSVAQDMQNQLVNGDGTSNSMAGMLEQVDASKIIAATGANGDILSFEKLDELADEVTDKNGIVDFFMMNRRDIRTYRALLRSMGGAGPDDVYTMPNGAQVIAYNGIPIFANDYIPKTQTQGSSTNASTIIAGNFDDGSRKVGMTLLVMDPTEARGVSVKYVGTHQTKDEEIWRVKWYGGYALWNKNGLAVASGIVPA